MYRIYFLRKYKLIQNTLKFNEKAIIVNNLKIKYFKINYSFLNYVETLDKPNFVQIRGVKEDCGL